MTYRHRSRASTTVGRLVRDARSITDPTVVYNARRVRGGFGLLGSWSLASISSASRAISETSTLRAAAIRRFLLSGYLPYFCRKLLFRRNPLRSRPQAASLPSDGSLVFTPRIPLKVGTYSWTAKATDKVGHVTTVSGAFAVANSASKAKGNSVKMPACTSQAAMTAAQDSTLPTRLHKRYRDDKFSVHRRYANLSQPDW